MAAQNANDELSELRIVSPDDEVRSARPRELGSAIMCYITGLSMLGRANSAWEPETAPDPRFNRGWGTTQLGAFRPVAAPGLSPERIGAENHRCCQMDAAPGAGV